MVKPKKPVKSGKAKSAEKKVVSGRIDKSLKKQVSKANVAKSAAAEAPLDKKRHDLELKGKALGKEDRRMKKKGSTSKLIVPKPDPAAFSPEKPKQPIPTRSEDGDVIFVDHPEFKPNMTPKEVLRAGSFGGTYFRDIYSSVLGENCKDVWKELPSDWLEGLDIKTQVASQTYSEEINRYKAKCGGSLQMWEESGWIKKQDPYGWFQWYCRFYQGRRTKDDERQISRWSKCTGDRGRWRNNLITKIVKSNAKYNDSSISPVVRQVLLHWSYTLTEKHYEIGAKLARKRLKL